MWAQVHTEEVGAQTQGEWHGKTEAEVGMTLPRAQEHRGWTAGPRKPERLGTLLSYRLGEERGPANNVILDS